MSLKIYKICKIQEWRIACIKGTYSGSQVDLQDGFIHFSTQSQLRATAQKHFKGRKDLVLVEIDSTSLPLTWEPSRGGDLFPHLYQDLPVSGLEKTWVLMLDENNMPMLPFE